MCYNYHDAMKLKETLHEFDDEDEDEDNDDEKKHVPSRNEYSDGSGTQVRRSSLRWPSERLNQSTLRDLTAATFEYNLDGVISDESDEDEDETGSRNDTSILPLALRISEENLGSLLEEEKEE